MRRVCYLSLRLYGGGGRLVRHDARGVVQVEAEVLAVRQRLVLTLTPVLQVWRWR
ncbi:hypothetical protein STRIP9103_02709 [Streptomyces ipomoeae 91-03]|uniref:Uncharacterized protein n=1 Tax=Streptomyces ipomoeae 91-03 TaxID=698759 RepID=L1KL09_9ACTN|nr:hypothetical protein STRIP9103_02709 [Streptomyces ipomoeae 91-03]